MAVRGYPKRHGEDVFEISCAPGPLDAVERPEPCLEPFGALNGGISTGRFLDASSLNVLRRCTTRENLTGASLPRIKRELARAWRLMLAQQTNEAYSAIERIELQLDDVPPAAAERLQAATSLLRGVGLALQDHYIPALAIAVSLLRENAAGQGNHAAATLCRLGYWQLGKFDAFHLLPRHQPRVRGPRSHAISAMFDLSIEAAVALDHLHMPTAKQLAVDALAIAETSKVPRGLAALPACLAAQVLYEEGRLDEADTLLRDRLSAINAEGSIECALRAYLVLTRIARHRMHYDLAAILLREAEALGERRGWLRLVAACVAERTALLLEAGRTKEARLNVEQLDRHDAAHRAGPGRACSETLRYCQLARWRVAWAEAPSMEAVAALRQLYHHAAERRDLYTGCRLAVELADMLMSIGEVEEAGELFFQTVKSGAAAGLYQVFLERGGSGMLLRRAYDRAEAPGSTDREVLPLVGSLLSRWDDRHANGRPARSGDAISDTLTARECDILVKISQGFPNKRIARALEISPETVKSHIKRVFLKLAVSTRAEAVSQAKLLGLL